MCVNAHPCNRAVAKVSHLLDLCCEVRVDVEKALPPVPDTVVTPVGGAPLHLHPVRDELQVGVAEGEECIEVAPVEGVKRMAEEFDRLQRHRPLSIPQAQESA
jgi:hypothetical protein